MSVPSLNSYRFILLKSISYHNIDRDREIPHSIIYIIREQFVDEQLKRTHVDPLINNRTETK
jgi:hypothetical protein